MNTCTDTARITTDGLVDIRPILPTQVFLCEKCGNIMDVYPSMCTKSTAVVTPDDSTAVTYFL